MALGTLLIRADASAEIGTGHVMRCVALAQGWQHAGGKVVFALAESTPSILERLRSEGFASESIAALAGSQRDARRTAALALANAVRWVVADGYRFGHNYQHAIIDSGLHLLCIDDNGEAGEYCADLVLNQNLHAREPLYSNRDARTRLLLGPAFILLRREFEAWRQWEREIGFAANRILIAMGGSDPRNLNSVVLRALQSIPDDELQVRIATGGSNPRVDELRRAAETCRGKVQLDVDANMPELMAWADLAIAGAGATCWEMCLLSLPALVIDVAGNQAGIAASLEKASVAVHLGNWREVTAEIIAAEIEKLRRSRERRQLMSQSARSLVDGCGAQRVLREILQHEAHAARIGDGGPGKHTCGLVRAQ
jgi:UDP-2,4-diacetamido-2,4,6-trideoxy-beta-L-altropyranose hydrolase